MLEATMHEAARQLVFPSGALEAALAGAGVGLWSWEPGTDRLIGTNACTSLLGLTGDAFDGTLAGALEHVCANDRLGLQEAIVGVTEHGGPIRREFRVEVAGAERWLQATASPAPSHAALRATVVGTFIDIDARKRALAASMQREQEMRSLADNAPSVVARFDRDLRHLFVNPAIEEVTGLPREAFVGKTNRELGMPEGLCDEWDATFHRVLETGESTTLAFEFAGVDGSRRSFRNRVVPEPGLDGRPAGLLVVGHEVTEIEHARERLARSDARLRRAQRAGAVGTWDWDIESGEASWTEEAYRLFGQVPGTPVTFELWQQSIHPNDRARAMAEVEEAATHGDRYDSEYRVLAGDLPRWVEVCGEVEHDDEGRPVRMLGTVRDVTESRRAERELRAAARSRDQLLSFVSHDLRSPMQTLGLAIEALRAWVDDGAPGAEVGRAERTLNRMARQVTHMRNLVAELVGAAKGHEPVALDLRYEETDLVALAKQLAREHAARAASGRVVVRAAVDRLVGRFDVAKLKRILDNLLSNAVKYSDGEPDVRLEVDAVEEAGRRWALVTVRDRGIGIPDAEQAHVFDWFGRASNARDSSAPGSGVGLTSVRNLVARHQGTIHLVSEEGAGTAVTVKLPLDL